MAPQPSGSTSHLGRHLNVCMIRLAKISGTNQKVLSFPSVDPEGKLNSLTSFKYDKENVREVLAKMIIVHEYPFRMVEHPFFVMFAKSLNPRFEPMSRVTIKSDCMKIYALEKKKLMAFFTGIRCFSLTSDLWTSNQTVGYMTITAHFVDPEWKLQKRVINFCHIPPPHTGVMISDSIFTCLNSWGIENKISTITLDNATSNDSAARHLKDSFSLKGNLHFGGKIFHVRCCAHILNIMVQDGLDMIEDVTANVRNSVKYLKGSPSRLHRFYEIARQCQLSNVKKLTLDVPTRWNSTYAMLNSALIYKDVFPRYHDRDPFFRFVPSEEDWEKVIKVIRFLEVFYEATTVFSGYEYPTSNIFLPEIWKIKELLLSTCVDESEFMRNMAIKMKVKFDKYWAECNLLMAIATVLDPRYKMFLIHFCFPRIYLIDAEAKRNTDLVVKTLHELYDHYVANQCKAQSTSSISSTSKTDTTMQMSGGTNVTKSIAEFNTWAQGLDHISTLKSDLDVYLEEGRYICSPGESFDALQWWKSNTLKFRVLSEMAKDILSVPITTVASESTFSAGGRVLDQYRSSLKPNTVEALICTSDWLRAEYKIPVSAPNPAV